MVSKGETELRSTLPEFEFIKHGQSVLFEKELYTPKSGRENPSSFAVVSVIVE